MLYHEMFVNRLKEAGIEVELNEIAPNKYTTHVPYNKNNNEIWHCHTLAVQGLIYHFSNRKWIVNDNYMYIDQCRHVITFNDGSVETD